MPESINNRLFQLINELGLSQKDFASRLGVNPTNVAQLKRRGIDPAPIMVSAVCSIFGVNRVWLELGDGKMFSEASRVSEDLVFIPRLEVQASAGDGSFVIGEEVREHRPFRRDEIKRYRTNPENLTIIEVKGDSMRPTFMPGDEVMVDLTWPQSMVNGIYAVRVNQTLMLKRIEQLPGNRLTVMSDNPAYSSFDIDMEVEDGNFQIIGRVVWGATRY